MINTSIHGVVSVTYESTREEINRRNKPYYVTGLTIKLNDGETVMITLFSDTKESLNFAKVDD